MKSSSNLKIVQIQLPSVSPYEEWVATEVASKVYQFAYVVFEDQESVQKALDVGELEYIKLKKNPKVGLDSKIHFQDSILTLSRILTSIPYFT